MAVAGSAVGMIGAPNLRGPFNANNSTTNSSSRGFQCHPEGDKEAVIVLSLGMMGVFANTVMMLLILIDKRLRSWSQGLLFHQGVVDCGRAAILLPLGFSILNCEPIRKCTLLETAFLLLVTVSTINMLTIVLNDSPIFPDDGSDEELVSGPLLMDSPQCVLFGTFMIWFASVIINLGPTFLSGGLAARNEMIRNTPGCPLVHGPFRHYILNALWIVINVICVLLTLFHLHKLHRDLTKANVEAVKVAGLVTTLVNVTGSGGPISKLPKTSSLTGGTTTTQNGVKPIGVYSAVEEHRRMRNYLLRIEKEGVKKVKIFLVITGAYIIFWGPLFLVTLARNPILGGTTGYEVTLHVAYLHAFINPMLFIILHRGLRYAIVRLILCCYCRYNRSSGRFIINENIVVQNLSSTDRETDDYLPDEEYIVETTQDNLPVPPPPPPAVPSTLHTQQHLTQSTTSLHSRYCQHEIPLIPAVNFQRHDQNFMQDEDLWEDTLFDINSGKLHATTIGPPEQFSNEEEEECIPPPSRLISFHRKHATSFSHNSHHISENLHQTSISSLSLQDS